MAKPKTDNEKMLGALEAIKRRLDDLFILEAARAGIRGHEIRAMLGIDMSRVTGIARHVKEKEK